MRTKIYKINFVEYKMKILKQIKHIVIDRLLGDVFNLYIRRLHPKEAVRFAQKYFENKKIDCAEIGVFKGENSKYILKTLKVNKIYLIDPYEKYTHYKSDESYKSVIKAKKITHNKLKSYKNCKWIEKFSEKAFLEIPDLDFLYIDGNHEYEYVKKDMKMYWNKIRQHGIMAGHDIDWQGVSKALMEFIKENNISGDKIFFGNKTDWWIVKD